MQTTAGGVFIAVGLFLLYMLVTGKMDCFYGAFACAFQGKAPQQQGQPQGNRPAVYTVPTLPQMPVIPRQREVFI